MRIEEIRIDPRTKLIIVLCLSTLGIVFKDIISLIKILLTTILISICFHVDLMGSIKKLKSLLYILIVVTLAQSIFSSDGTPLVTIGKVTFLTTEGLYKGLEFIFRMMIIIFSATILTTSSSREIVQGFVQWGLPYEVAFMVAIGIRFLPILTEEIKDSLIAIQLRGIELDKIPIKKRIHVYSYLFTPIVLGTISKAERLSIAIEMRGFRAYDSRTSYMVLKMSILDYIIIFMSIVTTIIFYIVY